jgi:hypothetical protein
MAEELEFPRGEGAMGEVTVDDLTAFWEARLQGLYEQAMATPREELAEPLYWWEVFGLGPYQPGATTIPPADFFDQPLLPNRIIQVGEEAVIYALVFLNPSFPSPPACSILTNFGAKIELNYWTCNTQTCTPAPLLHARHVIELEKGQCWYLDELRFTAQEAACLYETNICARVLNCGDVPVQPFAAFVRWVYDPDSDLFFGSEEWEFDRPIRFMVSEF